MQEIAAILIIFLAFSFVHTVCVRDFTKDFIGRLAGETFVKAFYRLLYCLFSFAATAAAFAAILKLPDVTIYAAPPWLRRLMRVIQLTGFFFGISVFRVLDPWEFLGFRQAWRFITRRRVSGDKEGLAVTRLITYGPYGVVRHPLYTAGIIIFSLEPVITRNRLTVSILACLYFVYGALSEERRMLARFGPAYRDYMKNTPRFLPRLR